MGLADSNIFYENLKTKLSEQINGVENVECLESLGLIADDPILKLNTPLDTVSHFLSKKLNLASHERDLVILRHEIGITWPDNRKENRGINFVVYGEDGGHSAMAKTVGYPAAIAVKMILDGKVIEIKFEFRF